MAETDSHSAIDGTYQHSRSPGSEIRHDSGRPLLLQEKSRTSSKSGSGLRQARKVLSIWTLLETLADLIMSLAALYFIIFGILVYRQRGRPADDDTSKSLLKASRIGPTIFPIAFAAIVGKALRSIAAFRLEHGSSVLTLESILGSRSVFGVLRTPVLLRAISVVTPLLIALWALSPLGGQASLRIVSTVLSLTNTNGKVSFFNFTSTFTNEGSTSPSAGILNQINAIFTAALISPPKSKVASQDLYGNIKIPMIEYLAEPANSSGWVELNSDNFVYSNLLGLPSTGIPSSGKTTFTMETQYMVSDCSLNHTYHAHGAEPFIQFQLNSTANYFYANSWNGENYFMRWDPLPSYLILGRPDRDKPIWVDFQSIGSPADNWCMWQYLTEAYCTVTYSYVEVAIECHDNNCASTAIRKSHRPHPPPILVPIGGLADIGTMWTSFFPNFINSTYTQALCDGPCCSSSPLEAYLLSPEAPYSILNEAPPIWNIGDKLFSQRFSQLLNTYWLASVAPLSLLGNFSVMGVSAISDANATVETSLTVIQCDSVWLVILLLASFTMLFIGVIGAVLNTVRKGPDVLDTIGALLKDHPSIGIEQGSSMEDGTERVRRLQHLRVRLGDVRPEDNVGQVAIGPAEHGGHVGRLTAGREYG